MAKYLLHDFIIKLDNYQNDIIALLKIIKSSWKRDSINVEPVNIGFSGRIFRCNEVDLQDTLIVRICNVPEKTTWENNNEFKIIQYLSKSGHFPIVHAIFANGYCYEYIEGEPMFSQRQGKGGYIDDVRLRAIAREMAYLHKIKLDNVDYTKTTYFTNWKETYSAIPFIKIGDSSPSKESMFREMEFVDKYLLTRNPRIVTCHGDAHAGNFLWDQKREKLTILDWEEVSPGYQLQDIIFFFMTAESSESSFSDKAAETSIPKDFKRKFFRWYLEEWYQSEEARKEITDKDVEGWLKETEVFALAPFLRFITVVLTVPEEIEEDKVRFLERMLNEYLKLKEKLTGKPSFEITY